MEFKVNIADQKGGKTHKKDISGQEADALMGVAIGQKVKGEKLGFSGYEFELTGGSDKAGFPMRKDVKGTMRKKILVVKGTGIRPKRSGNRVRKMVAPTTVNASTSQINLKVLKAGKDPLTPPPAQESEEEGKEEKKE